MSKKVLFGLLPLLFAACGVEATLPAVGDDAVDARRGTVRVTLESAPTTQSDITLVRLHVAPDDITETLTYDAVSGAFSGSLLLAPGEKELTATAFADTEPVGEGQAAVTVVTNQTASVFIRILDTTGAQPENDIAPIIRSVSVSNANPAVGETVTLSVDAVDLNGDALTYAWADDCQVSTFGTPAEATTTWVSDAVDSCMIMVTAYSTAYSAAKAFNMVIFDAGAGEGSLSVSGEFASTPYIDSFHIDYVNDVTAGTYPGCELDLYAAAGEGFVCPTLTHDMPLSGYFYSYFGTSTGARELALSDDCGGRTEYPGAIHQPLGTTQGFVWYPPEITAPTICRLTAIAGYYGLTTYFDVGILVDY